MSDADPRCPECGGKIGQTATYCMHCSADLTDARNGADTDGDGSWDGAGEGSSARAADTGDASSGAADVPWAAEDDGGNGDPEPTWGADGESAGGTSSGPDTGRVDPAGSGDGEPVLDPDGLVDNSLTAIVGIVGGLVVGVVGTVALLILTGSGWAVLVGILVWLGATAYLVRRRTVQGAVAKSGYAVAAVLLLLPLVAFSPLADVEGGLSGRIGLFVVTLVFAAVPAGVAAAIGYVASRFVPADAEEIPT